MSNVLLEKKDTMSENIESMESLMTIFGCDLFTIEYLLLQLGECYYLNPENYEIEESFLSLMADEAGNIDAYLTNIKTQKTIKIKPDDVYIYVSKDIEDCELLQINLTRKD